MTSPDPLLTVQRIREGLARRGGHGRVVAPAGASAEVRQAAVAAIARQGSAGAEILLIRRADRAGDPWSGHIAFPGGRLEPGDESAEAAAVRETREELGLDLARAGRPLGALTEVVARSSVAMRAMVVRPFVFELVEEPPPFLPNSEVREVIWLPLAFLLDGRNRGSMPWTVAGTELTLPCYRFDGHVLWGMTLRMVDELLELL